MKIFKVKISFNVLNYLISCKVKTWDKKKLSKTEKASNISYY